MLIYYEGDWKAMNYYLGVDLGGTNIAAGVVDENCHIIARDSVPVREGHNADTVLKDVVEIASRTARSAGFCLGQFTSLGIGMPSMIHPKTHLIMNSNNLGWQNIPVFEYLQKYTDMPVYIENDANCAAYGEMLAGAGRYYDNAVMLTLGTGVGGGIIMDRKIYKGADQLGAELGHTKLVYNGELCTCGLRGCLEAYCSATALIRQGKMALKENPGSLLQDLCAGQPELITGKMIFDACARNDETALHVVDQFIDYLTAGISSFIAIFRPEAVILGGGIAEAGEMLLRPVNERLFSQTYSAAQMGVPQVIKAQLGNDAGIIGAAMLEKCSCEVEKGVEVS